MAPYESDSSFDEEDIYNETSVLLGYASKKSTDDNISQLGGFPVSLRITMSLNFRINLLLLDMARWQNCSVWSVGEV